MKLGYSILLGETIEARQVQYKDCERFQIVCPECKEPVFKVRRGADTPEESHFLAHFAAAAAYQGSCELRVGRQIDSSHRAQNSVAREQRLAYFLSVLRKTIGMSPLYSTTAEKSHWRLNNAPGIELVRSLVWEDTVLPNRESFFDEGSEDYLWQLDEAGWALATSFSLERQRQIARDMWLTITTPAGHGNFNFLWNHGYLREFNKVMNAIDDPNSEDDGGVSARMAGYMELLVKGKKGQVGGILQEMANTFLPPGFNLTREHSAPDEEPSSYFMRLMSNISIESIGTLLELPYFELLKQQYGDQSKVYPYTEGIQPVDAEEIDRINKLKARHQARVSPSTN